MNQVKEFKDNELFRVRFKNLPRQTPHFSALCSSSCMWGLSITFFGVQCSLVHPLHHTLIISLEDHVLLLICKIPIHSHTHLFPFHGAPSCCARCGKHDRAVLSVSAPLMCNQGATPNYKAHCCVVFNMSLRHSSLRTQPINAASTRVIVLLSAYKYIKRCLLLIYSINCLEQIY